MEKFVVSHSPHALGDDTTKTIMLDVVVALIPALILGVILFGPKALILVLTCVLFSILAETVSCKILKKPISTGDFSSLVTGLLLGLNLSVETPIWIAALGSIIAIVVVKQLFGGIGQNFANPAITARIILTISFPAAMTNWVMPLAWVNELDTISSATPLANLSAPEFAEYTSYSLKSLLFGLHPGCIGEGCSIVLIAGGIYLIARKIITPTTPLAYILSVGILSFLTSAFSNDILLSLRFSLFNILSGGLLLGAIFMATDYSTSPVTFKGKLIFGIGCGIITFVIRQFGSYPEGVSFAILLMNILTPLIDKITKPKPFVGEVSKK